MIFEYTCHYINKYFIVMFHIPNIYQFLVKPYEIHADFKIESINHFTFTTYTHLTSCENVQLSLLITFKKNNSPKKKLQEIMFRNNDLQIFFSLFFYQHIYHHTHTMFILHSQKYSLNNFMSKRNF